MKLTSDNETLAENKVLILYILNKIGKPVSNDSLKLNPYVKNVNYESNKINPRFSRFNYNFIQNP